MGVMGLVGLLGMNRMVGSQFGTICGVFCTLEWLEFGGERRPGCNFAVLIFIYEFNYCLKYGLYFVSLQGERMYKYVHPLLYVKP